MQIRTKEKRSTDITAIVSCLLCVVAVCIVLVGAYQNTASQEEAEQTTQLETEIGEDFSVVGVPEDNNNAGSTQGEVHESLDAAEAENPDGLTSEESSGTEDAEPAEPTGSKRPSIYDLLKTALQPVGSTMYVYWGGWTEPHGYAADELTTIGVSERWADFAAEQDKDYRFSTDGEDPSNGLNCTGYVAWTVYNTLEDSDDANGGYAYVANDMAYGLASEGLGSFIHKGDISEWQAGDIVSMPKHVFIVVGQCEDGSVVLLHSSPPGVALAGTLLPNGSFSQATALATWYMAQYYPEWHDRYYVCWRSYNYLSTSELMRWSSDVLTDEENLRGKSAEEVLELILGPTA